jgi:hypothetical protein
MAEAKEQKWTFELESVKLVDRQVSRDYLVSLAKPGQATQLEKLKAFGKLMICYASIVVGTKNVSVNN